MNDKYDYLQKHVEWEFIDEGEEITFLEFQTNKFRSDSIIKFSRDSQFRLKAIITGIAEDSEDLKQAGEDIAGSLISGDTVIGYSHNNIYKYTLSGFIITNVKTRLINFDSPIVSFESEVLIDKIEKEYRYGNDTAILKEWFLSGKNNILFPRSTERTLDKTYKLVRHGIDDVSEGTRESCSGNGRDYALIVLEDTSFIVSSVPRGFVPLWSHNFTIEYRESFGRIPTSKERKAISEIVSFIFGNELIKIGHTCYGANRGMSFQEFKNLNGGSVISKCQNHALPPVDIERMENWGKVESLLNIVVQNYLNIQKSLALSDCIARYWVARYSLIGINLPILSAAVEILADKLLKQHPEKKTFYIAYKEFGNLINDELISISEKLGENEFKERILNKLRGASQRGSNEKLEMMLEIIELPIGIVERKAIKARNKMAHSSSDEDDRELDEVLKLTRAYETLFNRILLKLLSYTGDYIDYYTLGHPNRKIDEVISEVNI